MVRGGSLTDAGWSALAGASIGILTGGFGHSAAFNNALSALKSGIKNGIYSRSDLAGSLADALAGFGLGLANDELKKLAERIADDYLKKCK